MMSNVNNKYKTTLCKHYEQTGFCHMAAKCHFAHGKAELRGLNDPIPMKTNFINQQQKNPSLQGGFQASSSLPPTIANYKTMKCKFFEKGFCKYNQNCAFAHGDHEIRNHNSPLPQNVLNATVTTSNQGPSSLYDSNVQNQIAQQQIFYLINQMEAFHGNNQEIMAQVKQAKELNTNGNVQTAASVIYNIINRKDKSKEDSDHYANFVQNIQSLGPTLYQQYSQQASSLGLFGFNNQSIPQNNSNQVLGGPQNLSPYNPHLHQVNIPQMDQFDHQPHYKQAGQQIPQQDNNPHNLGNSLGNDNMHMLELGNMMGSLKLMGGMPNYPNHPNPMSVSANLSSSKNFGN